MAGGTDQKPIWVYFSNMDDNEEADLVTHSGPRLYKILNWKTDGSPPQKHKVHRQISSLKSPTSPFILDVTLGSTHEHKK